MIIDYATADSCNGVVLTLQQAICWTDETPVTEAYLCISKSNKVQL